MDTLKPQGKPFAISKWEVWEAYRQVKANKGAPGVDGCSLEDFEKDLQGNLYKLWNRSVSCKLRWTCRWESGRGSGQAAP